METIIRKIKSLVLLITVTSLAVTLFSCSDDNEGILLDQSQLSTQEKDALLFMLEEEKMARDVYTLFYEKWQSPIFNNISQSETNHISAVSNLLDYYDIEYQILGYGEFNNENIKSLYNQLIANGEQSLLNAYIAGASIEDLDIYDLQQALNDVEQDNIIIVFERLQCGSRNHLRSFFSAIENSSEIYVPQYISQEQFDTIINSENEQCN